MDIIFSILVVAATVVSLLVLAVVVLAIGGLVWTIIHDLRWMATIVKNTKPGKHSMNQVYYWPPAMFVCHSENHSENQLLGYQYKSWRFHPESHNRFVRVDDFKPETVKKINGRLLAIPTHNRNTFLHCARLVCGNNKNALSFVVLTYMLNRVHDYDWTKWKEVKDIAHFHKCKFHTGDEFGELHCQESHMIFTYVSTGSLLKAGFVGIKYFLLNVWFLTKQFFTVLRQK